MVGIVGYALNGEIVRHLVNGGVLNPLLRIGRPLGFNLLDPDEGAAELKAI
jgi:hypothetical protein